VYSRFMPPAPWAKQSQKAEILDGMEAATDYLFDLSSRQIDAIRESDFEPVELLNEQMAGVLQQRSALIRRFVSLTRKPN
jgi:hypothetical protein